MLDAVEEEASQYLEEALAKARSRDAELWPPRRLRCELRRRSGSVPQARSPTEDGTLTEQSGLLVVDKPAGWTSHQVVGRLPAPSMAPSKVGHAGTLDPMATGVLLVGA